MIRGMQCVCACALCLFGCHGNAAGSLLSLQAESATWLAAARSRLMISYRCLVSTVGVWHQMPRCCGLDNRNLSWMSPLQEPGQRSTGSLSGILALCGVPDAQVSWL